MELLTGGSLSAFVERHVAEHGSVDPRALLSWMVDSACGLALLHSSDARPVVHRDLKPDNFLVRQCSDGSAVVVLGDLGESKALSSSQPVATSAVGNSFTKAPEVLRGSGYGPYSDVYSWALTMLTITLQGVPSPGGGGLVADPCARYVGRRNSLVEDGLVRLAAVDGDVASLLRRCVAEEFAERPAMKEVVTVLLAVAGDGMRRRAAAHQGVTVVEWLVSGRVCVRVCVCVFACVHMCVCVCFVFVWLRAVWL